MSFRWLTSVAITWAFLAALMTATAQQRVTAALDARADKPTYSSALAKIDDLTAARLDMTAKQTTSTKLTDQIQQVQKTIDDTYAAMGAAWDDVDVDSIAAEARKTGCDTNLPATTTDTGRYTVWEAMLGCWRKNLLSAPLAGQIKGVYGGDEDYAKLYASWAQATRAKSYLAGNQQRVDGEIAADKKKIDDGDSLNTAFTEVSVLRSPWLGLGFLIKVPPAMLQIVLAFISGAFGALLVTLVLVVYPKSQLAGAAGAVSQEYGARLLLGGLISVGVFVILSGGSAVLGSPVAFSQNQANFMTFSAVGVLAGMFSDRVAAWLSERANAFFSDHKIAEAANDPRAEAAAKAAAKVAAE